MEELILFYNELPQFFKILIIILGIGIIFSIFKKFLKVAILFAVLIILIIVIMKLISGA